MYTVYQILMRIFGKETIFKHLLTKMFLKIAILTNRTLLFEENCDSSWIDKFSFEKMIFERDV